MLKNESKKLILNKFLKIIFLSKNFNSKFIGMNNESDKNMFNISITENCSKVINI